MSVVIKIFGLVIVSLFVGCASIDCKVEQDRIVHPVSGTNTAVIGIGLDKNGVPTLAAKEIILEPGQKALFAGPDEFTVIFKNKKTPNRKIDNSSVNGVVVIQIPAAIFEQREFAEEYRKSGQVKFSYGVMVNGKELDPDIVIRKK